NFDIKQPVLVAELSMEKLIGQSNKLIEYQPLPIYPAVLRDLALIVDNNIKAGDIVYLVKKTGGDIVESVQIFDFYTGKQIEKGKKSIAFAINYRSSEGSLSSEQVNDIQQVIIEKLKKEFNVEIRDK
ncbi:MAG: phenylalanine--tRNA ligase subunit beta, partial [FCB group bacterium]|nr:phenylalanine--tRNA ligase subunit beta [FCB group bacterium]